MNLPDRSPEIVRGHCPPSPDLTSFGHPPQRGGLLFCRISYAIVGACLARPGMGPEPPRGFGYILCGPSRTPAPTSFPVFIRRAPTGDQSGRAVPADKLGTIHSTNRNSSKTARFDTERFYQINLFDTASRAPTGDQSGCFTRVMISRMFRPEESAGIARPGTGQGLKLGNRCVTMIRHNDVPVFSKIRTSIFPAQCMNDTERRNGL